MRNEGYFDIQPVAVKNAALNDIKICAYNYYNKIHPFKADMAIIDKLIKEEIANTGLSEIECAEIVKRKLRKQFQEKLEKGQIDKLWT